MESVLWTTDCYEKDSFVREEKHLVPEIEYSLYVNGEFYSGLSCSPWHLEDLVYGMLYGKDDIVSCIVKEEEREIYVMLEGSSADVSVEAKKKEDKSYCILTPEKIRRLSALLDDASGRFRLTGGVHSAAIADKEQILLMREDVGRHNAMDKLLGACLREHVDTSDKVILFSGRVAAEVIEKAAYIGCSAIIAVSAPTNRACELAVEKGILLVGFARGERFNVYTFPERVYRGEVMQAGRESQKDNDLFFTCSLVDYIARKTKNTRADIVNALGKKRLEKIYDLADIYHSDNIERVSKDFIEEVCIKEGSFDNVKNCGYSIPTHWDIGKVYKRLIKQVAESENIDIIDALIKVYNSFISQKIDDYNSSVYYENPSYIYESYRENKML